MEIACAPNNLRILLLLLMRKLLQKCFHWKIQLSIIQKRNMQILMEEKTQGLGRGAGSFSCPGKAPWWPAFPLPPLSRKQGSRKDSALPARWRDQRALVKQHIPGVWPCGAFWPALGKGAQGLALVQTAGASFLSTIFVACGNYKMLLPVSCETPSESENYGLDHFLC